MKLNNESRPTERELSERWWWRQLFFHWEQLQQVWSNSESGRREQKMDRKLCFMAGKDEILHTSFAKLRAEHKGGVHSDEHIDIKPNMGLIDWADPSRSTVLLRWLCRFGRKLFATYLSRTTHYRLPPYTFAEALPLSRKMGKNLPSLKYVFLNSNNTCFCSTVNKHL